MKGTSGTQGETEVPGIKVSRGHCPFSKPSSHRAGKLMPYLRLPTTWLTLTCLGDPQRLCPTQLTGLCKLLFHKNGWSWLLNPIEEVTAGFSEP